VSAFEESLAPRTGWDVRFRLADISVRVHPFFWLSAILLGIDLRNRQGIDILTYMLVWVAVLFVSILIHELGHILMGRYFGSRGHIVLTACCGLAIGSAELPERWQRNLVSLAGPGAGFLFAGVLAGAFCLYSPELTLSLLGDLIDLSLPTGDRIPPPLVKFAMLQLLWINLAWGLVNLLPIWPLDGGQISREICQHYRGREGMELSLKISLGTAAAFAVLALIDFLGPRYVCTTLFSILFFAIFALVSWQLLRHIRMAGLDWEDQEDEPRAPWEQDADWWKRGSNPWD
jgi:stage IV sporulation protein FB